MPRQLRIQFPGAFYHVMARGDRREPIVLDDADRSTFLNTLGEAATRTGWRIHAYTLMPNHYHLVLETPEPNLVPGMTWLQTTYTVRFNTRHRLRGHLFAGRYKAVLAQHGEGDYFRTLIDYVHLNPVRAHLADPDSGLGTYPWTSLTFYRRPPSRRQPWQVASEGLAANGFPDTAAGRRHHLKYLESRARDEKTETAGVSKVEGQSLQSTLQRGWYYGTKAFRNQLLARADKAISTRRSDPNHHGREVADHSRRHAREIIDRGLAEFGLSRSDLPGLPKSDPRKALIALAIKRTTSTPQAWITSQLHMGVTAGVSRYAAQAARRMDEKGGRQLRQSYRKIVGA